MGNVTKKKRVWALPLSVKVSFFAEHPSRNNMQRAADQNKLTAYN